MSDEGLGRSNLEPLMRIAQGADETQTTRSSQNATMPFLNKV